MLGIEPMTLGCEARSFATLATEARLVVDAYPYTYVCTVTKDLPWFLLLEAPFPLPNIRSPTLELCFLVCFLPLASPLLLGNLGLPRFNNEC